MICAVFYTEELNRNHTFIEDLLLHNTTLNLMVLVMFQLRGSYCWHLGINDDRKLKVKGWDGL
jgi:hypothetical protein